MTRDVIEGEEWRPLPGFEGIYEVSNLGRVYSLKRPGASRSGRLMAPFPTPLGHLRVALCHGDTRRVRGIHQLVLMAFVGPRPAGLEVRHLNGVHGDNRLENLRYGTRSENMRDRMRHGRWKRPVPRNPGKNPPPICRNGHPYDEANTYYISSRPGWRHCRTCLVAQREARAANPRSTERRPERWKPIKHGTQGGYAAHRSRGVPISADDSCGCRRAAADAKRHRRSRRHERAAA